MSPQQSPERKTLPSNNDTDEHSHLEGRLAGIEEALEQQTSKNIINESLAITKKLETQKAGEDKQIGEVEDALRAYAQKQREKQPGAAPDPQSPQPRVAPEPKAEGG